MPYEGVATLFEAIVRNTQLTDAEAADAAGKHARVRQCLNRHYYGVESATAHSRVIGGYGKDTEIRPPTDVDILFKLPWSVFYRVTARTGNVQSRLLQEVKRVVTRSFPTTGMRADGQVVVVPFVTYGVEVLPAFYAGNGVYWYPDTNNGGSWGQTSPRAEKRALKWSNVFSGGKTIHLVKLAKAWKTTRRVEIKSVVLELAAVQFLNQWSYEDDEYGYAYYDYMLEDFFWWLVGQQNTVWSVPGGKAVSTGDAWADRALRAARRASRAVELGEEDELERAKIWWRRVLGSYVP